MVYKTSCIEHNTTWKNNLQIGISCTGRGNNRYTIVRDIFNAEEDQINKIFDAKTFLELGIDMEAREAQLIHTEVHSDIQYKMPEKYFVRHFSDISRLT